MNLPHIHLLRAAVMLAEVRNYSRTAKKLGIQQPTLTKWILELEHLIGFPLFLRTTQFVEPTEACLKFVEEAKQCIFHAERALHVARLAEQGAQTILHVGKSQYTDPYLVSVLTSITLPLYPNLEVSLSSMPSTEFETEVLLGRLDIALATGDFDNPKITQLELKRTPFFIAIPEHSPMATHKEITLVELHQKKWLLYERYVHPVLYDTVLRVASEQGVSPHSVHHVLTAEEAAHELYAGVGEAAFLSLDGAWRIARNGLTMRPLSESGLSLSAKLIARANDTSRVVSEFARTLKRKLEVSRRVQLDLPLNRHNAL